MEAASRRQEGEGTATGGVTPFPLSAQKEPL